LVTDYLHQISDHTNLADAYAIIPLMWSFGVTVGYVTTIGARFPGQHILISFPSPIMGGILANPVDRWPSVYRNLPLFAVHPYLLPCAAAALIAFASAGIASITLQEVRWYPE
jgi:hypothetical protein